ncbi:MAG: polysaccharide deacetylase family protein [Pseudomonadota bacterium]
MRRLARKIFYALLHYSGLNRYWRFRHRNHLTVLFIHGVKPDTGFDSPEPGRWQLSDAQLDKQLAYLVQRYEFVTPDEALLVLEGKKHTEKPAALFTIDDGYKSAYELAFPVLQRYNVPGIVFMATGRLEDNLPYWWDRLDYALLNTDASVASLRLADRDLPVEMQTRQQRADSARRVTRMSRSLFSEEPKRLAALQALIEEYERADLMPALKQWCGVMDADDLRAAQADGLMIGSHTVNHYRLGSLTAELRRHELDASKAHLESLLNTPIDYLCFPEGSASQKAAKAAQDSGYKAAFVAAYGLNAPGANRYLLKRVHLPAAASNAELAVLCSGLSHAISLFRTNLFKGSSEPA